LTRVRIVDIRRAGCGDSYEERSRDGSLLGSRAISRRRHVHVRKSARYLRTPTDVESIDLPFRRSLACLTADTAVANVALRVARESRCNPGPSPVSQPGGITHIRPVKSNGFAGDPLAAFGHRVFREGKVGAVRSCGVYDGKGNDRQQRNNQHFFSLFSNRRIFAANLLSTHPTGHSWTAVRRATC
jgi:hypothetical protein